MPHVCPAPPRPAPPPPCFAVWCKAIKRLFTHEEGFLNLEVGDLVTVQNKFTDTGHFSGILVRNDNVGLFPATYVKYYG